MSGEKTEKPTPKHLKDARKKGQVPQSEDVAHGVALLVIVEAVFAAETKLRELLSVALDAPLSLIGEPFDPSVEASFLLAGWTLLLLCLPVAFLGALSCVVGRWMQFGPLFAPEALIPKPEKFNPVQNFIEKFKGKNLATWVGNIVKVVLFCIIGYIEIKERVGMLVTLTYASPLALWPVSVDVLHSLCRALMLWFVVVAIIDLGVQRALFQQQMKMSVQDLRDEQKQTEGDPHVKGERRQFARSMLNQAAPPAAAPKVGAVVANPTHVAVALSPQEEGPITIVAMAGDHEAMQLIAYARREGIPIVQFVWLARLLYGSGRVGEDVPPDSTAAVSLVFAALATHRARYGDLVDTIQIDVPPETLLQPGRSDAEA